MYDSPSFHTYIFLSFAAAEDEIMAFGYLEAEAVGAGIRRPRPGSVAVRRGGGLGRPDLGNW